MSDRFDIMDTHLSGVKVLQRKPFEDSRGQFQRMFCIEELTEVIPNQSVAQINRSVTKGSGIVRGMHFQLPPHAETKIISCTRGELFDVCVDIRQNSPTFLSWHAEILSAQNNKSLVIPECFAHGYQTLTEEVEALYINTAAYHPEAEGGIRANDPRIAVNWPLPIINSSDKDAAHPYLDDHFLGVAV